MRACTLFAFIFLFGCSGPGETPSTDVGSKSDGMDATAGDGTSHAVCQKYGCDGQRFCVFYGSDNNPVSPDAGVPGRWMCTECIDDSDCAPGVKCFVDQFECGGPVAGDAGHDVGVDVGDAGLDGGEDSG